MSVIRHIVAGFWAALFLGFVSGVSAADKPIIVALESNDYYPHYQMEDGAPKGFAADLFQAFAKDTGIVMEFKSVPLKRILLEMPRGDIDIKYPDNPKWNAGKKQGHFFHSSPVVRYIDGVLVPPLAAGREPSEIHYIGTLYGFSPWPWMDRISDGSVTVEEIKTLEGLIKRMARRGFDGIYANIDVAHHIMSEKLKRPDLLVFDAGLPYADSYYAASTVKRLDILQRFDTWQQQADALKLKLEQKYRIGRYGILQQPRH